MQRGKIETGEIYHVYNRGVDKRTIFTNDNEYSYFIHLLYSLNDIGKTNKHLNRYFESHSHTLSNGEGSTFTIRKKRDRLVDVLAFVLMPNHYHLLLKQRVDDGIPKFMQKIGTGYTMLFNEKNKRSGALFQGRYKSVHISSNRQLLYIPHYIHLNPLSTLKNKSNNTKQAIDKLTSYKWSSLPDYCGNKNFPSVIQQKFIISLFGDTTKYMKDIQQFINNKKTFSDVDKKELIDLNIN